MEKEEKERMTYAREKLYSLVEKRELKAWCAERNLPHTTLYKIAVGTALPSFLVISSMLPHFSPAEWFFYTDEKIPYETKTLPVWNPDDVSSYVASHRYDFLSIAAKYDMTIVNARNIFINHRANPSFEQIMRMARDINPELFFTAPEEGEDGLFYPDRGDIVTINGKTVLVISEEDSNRKNKCFVGVEVEQNGNGIKVSFNETEGFCSIRGLSSFTYERKSPVLVGRADDETTGKVIALVKEITE